MKGRIAAVVLVGFWTFPLTPAVSRAEAPAARRTVLDGVFTVEQAKGGEKAFGSACSGCHGSDLAGHGFAPALAGPRFVGSWNGSTVKDLFELIRSSMPPDGAKGVSAETKADIIAHILTVNQYQGEGETARDLRNAGIWMVGLFVCVTALWWLF